MKLMAGDFIDNGDGTVTDNETGLMWQQEDDNVTRIWESAIMYCDGLFHADYSDWRLPSKSELASIIDHNEDIPAIETIYFPNTNSSGYWSSSRYSGSELFAWLVSFYGGDDYGTNKSITLYVRCVRGPVQK